jgi:hypothetical protein
MAGVEASFRPVSRAISSLGAGPAIYRQVKEDVIVKSIAGIECPSAVVVGVPFKLTAGFADAELLETLVGFRLAAPDDRPWVLSTQLVADDLHSPPDEAWRSEQELNPDALIPLAVNLTAEYDGSPTRVSTVWAVHALNGEVVNIAKRSIGIASDKTKLDAALKHANSLQQGTGRPKPAAKPPPGAPRPLQTGTDLTVTIKRAKQGRLAWTFESPHIEPLIPTRRAKTRPFGSFADFVSQLKDIQTLGSPRAERQKRSPSLPYSTSTAQQSRTAPTAEGSDDLLPLLKSRHDQSSVAPPAFGERPEAIHRAGVQPPDPTDVIHTAGIITSAQVNKQFALPRKPVYSVIGDKPEEFARNLMNSVNVNEGKSNQFDRLKGIGRHIAKQVHPKFWEALGEVSKRIGNRSPRVLILSEEHFIPWELAEVPVDLNGSANGSRNENERPPSPFLAGRAVIGRGLVECPLPSARALTISDIVAVSGEYTTERTLPEAVKEAQSIATTYNGRHVDAVKSKVMDCLKTKPTPSLLHFAVHGKLDRTGLVDGLIMVGDETVDPFDVEGLDLDSHPFVFLNACQVGAGGELLGTAAGMVEAFLTAGATGVVAALWSIDDKLSQEVALAFYKAAFAGVPIAEVLRTEREKFVDSAETTSATFLAYQFFGHPGLRLLHPDPQKAGGTKDTPSATAGAVSTGSVH